jgi:phosphoglycerate dehydrogenase-like enzyme
MRKLKILHIAKKKVNNTTLNAAFRKALARRGTFEVIENGRRLTPRELAQHIRNCNVLITFWGVPRIPLAVARNPGQLEYVCNLSGSVKGFVPLEVIDAGVKVTNWGTLPANAIAEGAMALFFAVVKGMHHRIRVVERGGWAPDGMKAGGSLRGLNVGVYGCGVIGRRFVEMLKPFQCVIRVFDPYVRCVPRGCIRVRTLRQLFAESQAIVIHAGLVKETRRSVTAELLALLPDNGIIVNTARGGIVDQKALFAELRKGRLRAGLDVLEPDKLPSNHPARNWENCIFTAHSVGDGWAGALAKPGLTLTHRLCLTNLKRLVTGRPLKFPVDRERYLRST